MINVYIISGFLGAGKTTFIQKLLKEHKFEKVMLLENEFGEVGVDGAFFDSSLKMKEINNGCICCSLQGDFKSALEEIESMGVSDLLIEPSGVGKLSEIIDVVKQDADFRIISHICIVDVKTAMKYHTNFKEYFDDQVKAANALILSHLDVASEEKIHEVRHMLKELNEDAYISNKPVEDIDIAELLDIIVSGGEIMPDLEHHHQKHDEEECCHHEHHHHHHDDEECECHHHHHDDEEECCHHHDDEDEEHHHHHHEHDEEHDHEHHHHHHHHHHDDEPFNNIALRPTHIFSKEEMENILANMDEDIIRVKGYVFGEEGTLYFNYVLNEYNVYYGEKRDNSLVVIIGTVLHEHELKEVFHD